MTLVLLSFSRREFEATYRAAKQGDAGAAAALNAIWDEYSASDLRCFLLAGDFLLGMLVLGVWLVPTRGICFRRRNNSDGAR